MDPFLKTNLGEYRVKAFVGEGAMGRVYRGEHRGLGRACAIKFLTAATGDALFARSLHKRAEAQLRVRDPGIATLYEVTEYRETPVLISEFVPGDTLHEIVEREGRWTLERTVPVLVEIARCLEHVHANGIVHSDLKCGNVKLTPEGGIKFLDFGVAVPFTPQTLHRISASSFATQWLKALAPEVIRGEEASPASDVWSFGVLGYHLLTGSPPFDGPEVRTLSQQISRAKYRSPRTANSAISVEMEAVLCRCLRREPGERYQSAGELRRALEAKQGTLGTNSRTGTMEALQDRWKAVLLTCAGGLVLASGVAAIEHLHAPVAPLASPTGAADVAATGLRGDVNELRRVAVATPDGPAEVWRDGRKIGLTPFTLEEPLGGTVQLVLKRPGYADLPVQFEVGERTSLQYTLQPRRKR